MADYAAENAATTAGAAMTERSGTASSDTIPAGCVALFRNTGAGSHTLTITTNNTVHGLAVTDQTITLTAGQIKASRIHADWGDANGRCALGIDGTASEIKYYLLGNV